jgi:hypothetical protein
MHARTHANARTFAYVLCVRACVPGNAHDHPHPSHDPHVATRSHASRPAHIHCTRHTYARERTEGANEGGQGKEVGREEGREGGGDVSDTHSPRPPHPHTRHARRVQRVRSWAGMLCMRPRGTSGWALRGSQRHHHERDSDATQLLARPPTPHTQPLLCPLPLRVASRSE